MTRSLDDPTRKPRIAIPMPHSRDREYAERAVRQYEEAVRLAGGEPVRIELGLPSENIQMQVGDCDGVLLPGSRADVDPRRYHQDRHEKTAEIDSRREVVDTLLLDDAYRQQKPVLGICYGLQSLNVYCAGSLLQQIESPVNHAAGRTVPNAHAVAIEAGSLLANIVGSPGGETLAVNSSHHQSAETAGEGLRVVAHSPFDGIVEALEGASPDHFVLAVQWHPERSVNDAPELAESARKIFRAFVEAARRRGSTPGNADP